MGSLSKHFDRSEFMCKGETCGCGFDTVDVDLLPVLIDLREHFQSPVYITSGCRCYKHNREVGSKDTSQHTKGKASDVQVKDHTSEEVYIYLDSKYPNKLGLGIYVTFVHIDVRDTKARW